MKKFTFIFSVAILSIFTLSCGKDAKQDCEKNNTGSIMIHNDGSFMPTGTADFYRGSTKITSLVNGASATINNIPVGVFTMTVKIGADTIYQNTFTPDTIKQCETAHHHTSDNYIPVSDKRLKKNILLMHDALANINKLNIYSFEYNAPKNYTGFLQGGLHYGFMAQELKDVYPTFVINNNNGYYSVNYQEMIPILAKGMQEQQTQIEDLKKEVEVLKSLIKNQQAVAMK